MVQAVLHSYICPIFKIVGPRNCLTTDFSSGPLTFQRLPSPLAVTLEPRQVIVSSTRAVPPGTKVVVPADVVHIVPPVQQGAQSTPVARVDRRPFRLAPAKILVVQGIISSQQTQVVGQLPRPAEVVHVHERMHGCYRLVVSFPRPHHDRKYFVPETVDDTSALTTDKF